MACPRPFSFSKPSHFCCFKGPRPPITQHYPALPSPSQHYPDSPDSKKQLFVFDVFWTPSFFWILATKMPNLSPKGPQKPPKWSPKGSQKPNFLGIRAEVKIELPLKRELNFQGPGPPKTSPKRCQKPEQPSDSVPDLTFEPPSRPLARFGRVLVDLGTPWGGSANSLLEQFLIRILKFGPRGSK